MTVGGPHLLFLSNTDKSIDLIIAACVRQPNHAMKAITNSNSYYRGRSLPSLSSVCILGQPPSDSF